MMLLQGDRVEISDEGKAEDLIIRNVAFLDSSLEAEPGDDNGYTVLHIAAIADNDQRIDFLINFFGLQNINTVLAIPDKLGNTPFICALLNKSTRVALVLLHVIFDDVLARKNILGNTALHVAIENDLVHLASLIITRMSISTLLKKNAAGFTAFDVCLKTNNHFIAMLWLKKVLLSRIPLEKQFMVELASKIKESKSVLLWDIFQRCQLEPEATKRHVRVYPITLLQLIEASEHAKINEYLELVQANRDQAYCLELMQIKLDQGVTPLILIIDKLTFAGYANWDKVVLNLCSIGVNLRTEYPRTREALWQVIERRVTSIVFRSVVKHLNPDGLSESENTWLRRYRAGPEFSVVKAEDAKDPDEIKEEIVQAIDRGSHQTLSSLHPKAANFRNHPWGLRQQALNLACTKNYIEAARVTLECVDYLCLLPHDVLLHEDAHESPIEIAARLGQVEILILLVKKIVEIEKCNKDRANFSSVVSRLIEFGFDFAIPYYLTHEPLMMGSQQNRVEELKIAIRNNSFRSVYWLIQYDHGVRVIIIKNLKEEFLQFLRQRVRTVSTLRVWYEASLELIFYHNVLGEQLLQTMQDKSTWHFIVTALIERAALIMPGLMTKKAELLKRLITHNFQGRTSAAFLNPDNPINSRFHFFAPKKLVRSSDSIEEERSSCEGSLVRAQTLLATCRKEAVSATLESKKPEEADTKESKVSAGEEWQRKYQEKFGMLPVRYYKDSFYQRWFIKCETEIAAQVKFLDKFNYALDHNMLVVLASMLQQQAQVKEFVPPEALALLLTLASQQQNSHVILLLFAYLSPKVIMQDIVLHAPDPIKLVVDLIKATVTKNPNVVEKIFRCLSPLQFFVGLDANGQTMRAHFSSRTLCYGVLVQLKQYLLYPGTTLLPLAAEFGLFDMVKFIMKKYKESVEREPEDIRIAFEAAVAHDYVDIIDFLLEQSNACRDFILNNKMPCFDKYLEQEISRAGSERELTTVTIRYSSVYKFLGSGLLSIGVFPGSNGRWKSLQQKLQDRRTFITDELRANQMRGVMPSFSST